ncbi:DNA gyrase inhibitor YacG [Nitrosomonas sp. ANs5]|uniref:DNA gyrase inhibitor YacG n=1 Tax=Nitrosomonas sp. ANs5 TaxID=3423941 RepID=UPI003D32F5E8
MRKPSIVNCPQCGEIVEWTDSNRFRPFCSERCKTVDLGQWATDTYRIPDIAANAEDDREPY